MAKSTRALVNHIPQTGRVEWIGLAPVRREPLVVVEEVTAQANTGLDGDRHGRSGRSKRQVTLIQAEHLEAVGKLLGHGPVDPGLTRRNVVVSGINLYALRNQRFRVGEVLMEGTGVCHPCSRMEENLGDGGFAAMRGHGGITARVLEGGGFAVGDSVAREDGNDPDIDEREPS